MLDYLQKDIDITQLSNFKTKAKARFYYEINSEDDLDRLSSIYDFTKKNNLGFLIIWWWTNLLFWFDIFNGVVIKNNLLWFKYLKESSILKTYSANLISDIAFDLENSLNQKIWHRFIWLPGSVWWAVFWNAWCFWLETENNFLEAKVLDIENNHILTFNKLDSKFEYRNSIFKKEWKYFIISILFDLSKKIEKYHSDVDNIYFRENKQPKWNSWGSFFKNPNKDFSAWKLIEEVWLKWYRLGTAYISDLHANFVMSDDNWNYRDLLDLISLVRDKVKEKYNIFLDNEVRIITN